LLGLYGEECNVCYCVSASSALFVEMLYFLNYCNIMAINKDLPFVLIPDTETLRPMSKCWLKIYVCWLLCAFCNRNLCHMPMFYFTYQKFYLRLWCC